jgi:ribose transport system permease protein
MAKSLRPSIAHRFYASGGAAMVGLLGAALGFSLLTPVFLSPANLLNVGRQTAVVSLVSIGMTFVIISGGIDLSVGSVVGLSGTLAAIAITQGFGPLGGAAIGLAVGTLVGTVNGFCIAIWRVPAIVTTLALLSIARGVALQVTNGRPISGLATSFALLGRSDFCGVPVAVILSLFLYLVAMAVLHFTPLGSHIIGLGGNEEAARLVGLKTKIYKLWIYSASGLVSGLAGLVLMSRLGSGQPTAGAGLELNAIAAVVLGGTRINGGQGSLIGTLFGAVLITVLGNGLDLLNVGSFFQLILVGIALLAAVTISQTMET